MKNIKELVGASVFKPATELLAVALFQYILILYILIINI